MPENIFVPHTFVKDKVFYFVRRVPMDLSRHYTSSKISYSLRTRSQAVAASRASRAASQLDEYWYHLRCQDAELPGKHMLRHAADWTGSGQVPAQAVNSEAMRLSEGVEVYLRLKGSGKGLTFRRAAERNCGYVIDICGDLPIDCYTKTDANNFRNALLERGMAGSSIARILGTVRSVVNFAVGESGIDITNPFGKVYFDRSSGVKVRKPVPIEAIRLVQQQCLLKDDDIRWLAAIIADTGMRLAEVAGLRCEDFGFDENGNVHVSIKPHLWRRLKTPGSERVVPLVGSAKWAAQRILENHGNEGFAFPRYNRQSQTNANAASASINKWLKEFVPAGATLHGFRHSMRDRLRAVECPSDIVDQIGGWQTDGVGQSYGEGYPLDVLRKWLKKISNVETDHVS